MSAVFVSGEGADNCRLNGTRARFQVPPAEDEQEDRMCVICQDKLNFLTTLDGCRHTFCFKCITLWRRQRREERQEPTCPLCRCDVRRCDLGGGFRGVRDFLAFLNHVVCDPELRLMDAVTSGNVFLLILLSAVLAWYWLCVHLIVFVNHLIVENGLDSSLLVVILFVMFACSLVLLIFPCINCLTR